MRALAIEMPVAAPVRNVPLARTKPVLRSVRSPVIPREDHARELCALLGLESDMAGVLGRLGATPMRLRKGAVLLRAGDPFTALYIVRSGFLKTVLLSQGGKNQVSGYHMHGDVLGITGISTETHDCDVVALEDSEVYALPFERIEELSLDNRRFQQHILALFSREIARRHNIMLMLGTMRAEQRLAAFLLELSQRYLVMGYSPNEYVLRMTREEIGSYLGLTLETISRLCTRFQQQGMIQAQGRTVKLLDRVALKRMISPGGLQ